MYAVLRATLLRVLFVLTTLTPWLMWFDLNAMALRFVQLRGHWPMCPTALPCRSEVWCDCDTTSQVWSDPIHRLLYPTGILVLLTLLSAPLWLPLSFAVGRRLPLVSRWLLLAAVTIGWALLIFDPTSVVSWYRD